MQNNQYEKAIQQYREVLDWLRTTQGRASTSPHRVRNWNNSRRLCRITARRSSSNPAWEAQGNLNQEYGFTLVKAGDLEGATSLQPEPGRGRQTAGAKVTGVAGHVRRRHRRAKARLEEAISLTNPKELSGRGRNRLFLSMLLDGQGNRAESLNELSKAARNLESAGSLPWLAARIGIAYARAGDLRSATRLLDVARKKNRHEQSGTAERSGQAGSRDSSRPGQSPGSLAAFRLADNEFHNALSVESLAHAYWLASDTNRAIETYDQFLAMKGRSLDWSRSNRG